MDAWSGQRSGWTRTTRPRAACSTRDEALTPLLADALVGARFWPVWIATGVLVLVAAIIASAALQNTSWAFVLPYMTVLAIAALGQMLVVMQAGIDLSTPGVMFLGGYLIVGVGERLEQSAGGSRSSPASASGCSSASSTGSSSGSSS